MEEDHTISKLVNKKRSSETFVLNNQNKHRVVINKIEILVHKYIQISKRFSFNFINIALENFPLSDLNFIYSTRRH
jgi:hypothetical protein